jgi:hypothetical protein
MAEIWPVGMAIKEDDEKTAGHAEVFIGMAYITSN